MVDLWASILFDTSHCFAQVLRRGAGSLPKKSELHLITVSFPGELAVEARPLLHVLPHGHVVER